MGPLFVQKNISIKLEKDNYVTWSWNESISSMFQSPSKDFFRSSARPNQGFQKNCFNWLWRWNSRLYPMALPLNWQCSTPSGVMVLFLTSHFYCLVSCICNFLYVSARFIGLYVDSNRGRFIGLVPKMNCRPDRPWLIRNRQGSSVRLYFHKPYRDPCLYKLLYSLLINRSTIPCNLHCFQYGL